MESKLIFIISFLALAGSIQARLIRAGIAPTQGAFALGRAWTEEPVLLVPGSNFRFGPNETAFAAVSLPAQTNPFSPVTAVVKSINITQTNEPGYFQQFKDSIIVLSSLDEARLFKKGMSPLSYVVAAANAGAVGALLQLPSLAVIPANTVRRLVNTFISSQIPVIWISDSGYSNLTQMMSTAQSAGSFLSITIVEPQNATIIFDYARAMSRSWVVLTQAYLGIFVILLVYAIAALVFRVWAMRNARQAGLIAKDRLLYLVLLLIVVENIILICIVIDYGGIYGRLPWFLSSHASIMFHASATTSPIMTLAVWWATIALDRIKLGFFTARNLRVLGSVAMSILWAVAVIQIIVEPLSENFSNTWAAVVQMIVVITCAIFCLWVGIKFALRLRASKKFQKSTHSNNKDNAMKRIETILVRTSIVLLIVLVTLVIFIPVAALSTFNIISSMFAAFVYASCSIVQMIAVITAVFTFPRNYSRTSSSSRHLDTSSGTRSRSNGAASASNGSDSK